MDVLKEHILRTLFDWLRALGDISSMSFLDLIDSLSLRVFCRGCFRLIVSSSFFLSIKLLVLKK
jgi:hypothetical protein